MERVALISDTHGLLRPELADELQGVERILHMGDLGSAEVLPGLEKIAPVVAVRGNVDYGKWARSLPETRTIELFGTRLHLLHNLDDLDLEPAAAGIGLVLFGHTHRPHSGEREGVRYVNPGSVGPRRFDLPASFAFLEPDLTVDFRSLA